MTNLKIRNFDKSKLHLALPYLLKNQMDSWEHFWNYDLKELFTEVSPISDYTGKNFELWFLNYKLGKSKYKSDLEARENNDSYEAPLRVKVRLKNIKTKQSREEEVFLANFPLMTERGTFVINGVERVIISQLIRSPGVFLTAKSFEGKNYFGAKIIPDRGAWLEFETENSGVISVKINRRTKVVATILLRIFGLSTDKEIKAKFQDLDNDPAVSYIDKSLARDPTHNRDEALVYLYQRIRPGDLATPDTARELIMNMFCNFNRYDLSKVGRWKTNKRLPELNHGKSKLGGDEITLENRVLHLDDIIAVVREIIRLNNTPGSVPDQIDHLGNRRVRTMSELLISRLRVGLVRSERIIKDRMSTLDSYNLNCSQIINPRPFMAAVQSFFATSQVSQFMDNQNPLSELEHKRRLTSTGPGGLRRKRAGFEVRDVQSSHYGRICPIETPEGPNIGLIGHLALYARINKYGFIETPYFKVVNGKVTNKVVYLDAYEEEKYVIAPGDTEMDDNKNIIPRELEARVKGNPVLVKRNEVDFIDVSCNQSISISASLIPFLQNDDAKRALMGSNMQRQAVPLINPEIPLVGTGLEQKAAKDAGQVILAPFNGVIIDVDASHIKIKEEKTGKEYSVVLRTFTRTNQYTCFHQKPIVHKGQKVEEGEVIADGGSTQQGFLSLGRNILVAILPWRGWNYEDAIIISEKLAREDYFTSIYIEEFSCDVRQTKLGPELTTADIPNVGEDKLKDLDEEGIVRIGAEVGPNDILVGKISPKGEKYLTPEESLIQAIFGEKSRDVKDTSLVMKHGKRGRVIGVKVFSRDKGCKLEPGVIKRIQIEVAQLRKITPGDKLAGRHGNKGVISKILPVEDMPFLADGTPVDMVLNPLSVISRMNLGQILETHLGIAAKKLGYIAQSPALCGANEEDIKKELQKAGLSEDGKTTVYDGITGKPFPKRITVGYMYIDKLNHMVEDKIHMRSIGPYSLITQQPLGGRAQLGGQRFGEMEVWALEGYGAAYALQEMLTIKSDDVVGRGAEYNAILKGEEIKSPNLPSSFNLLVNELRSLAFNIELKGAIISDS